MENSKWLSLVRSRVPPKRNSRRFQNFQFRNRLPGQPCLPNTAKRQAVGGPQSSETASQFLRFPRFQLRQRNALAAPGRAPRRALVGGFLPVPLRGSGNWRAGFRMRRSKLLCFPVCPVAFLPGGTLGGCWTSNSRVSSLEWQWWQANFCEREFPERSLR